MENGYEIELYFQNIYKSNICIYNFLGPKLPFALDDSTMISSLMEKSIVMIGGQKSGSIIKYSSDLLELSGDSKETLEWKILEQKLQYPRYLHVSFSISNDIAATLTTNSIASSSVQKIKMK